MSRRVAVNLAFFGVLGLVLSWWALTNVLRLDVVDRPYSLRAEFEESPGLQPDYDVAYLGVPVGTIESVELGDDVVEVELAVDDGREIPEGSTLAVRRKSAVGEPYVDFTPPPDGDEGAVLEDGDTIPVERTTTPLSYAELFDALNDLVAAVPPDDLATLLDELATGVDGRADSIRRLVTGGADMAETFAERSDVIEDAMESLSRLVGVFAEHRRAVGQGLDNSRAVAGTLAAANADVQRVLDQGSTLAGRTAELVALAEDDLTCTVGALGEVTVRLGQDDTVDGLARVLSTGPDARNVFLPDEAGGVVAYEDDGPYIRAIPPLNAGGNELKVYPSPRQLPAVPAVPDCPGTSATPSPPGSTTAGPGGASGDGAGPTPADDPGPDPRAVGTPASSDQEAGDDGSGPLWLVVGLLVVGLVAAARPWRWLPSRGGG